MCTARTPTGRTHRWTGWAYLRCGRVVVAACVQPSGHVLVYAQVKGRPGARKQPESSAVAVRKMSRARKASRSGSVASTGRDYVGGPSMTFVGGTLGLGGERIRGVRLGTLLRAQAAAATPVAVAAAPLVLSMKTWAVRNRCGMCCCSCLRRKCDLRLKNKSGAGAGRDAPEFRCRPGGAMGMRYSCT